eukprot:GHVS01079374.1.p1 GENE.GHVS01079374.1~~GHVS01079374.1.p1  ORF type:complete len:103 (+),score=0.85 GHVS01079374.1:37-345(+)
MCMHIAQIYVSAEISVCTLRTYTTTDIYCSSMMCTYTTYHKYSNCTSDTTIIGAQDKPSAQEQKITGESQHIKLLQSTKNKITVFLVVGLALLKIQPITNTK